MDLAWWLRLSRPDWLRVKRQDLPWLAALEVPFAAVVSYLAFGDWLDGWQIVGTVLAVSGVVLLVWPSKVGVRRIGREQLESGD